MKWWVNIRKAHIVKIWDDDKYSYNNLDNTQAVFGCVSI